MWKPCKVHLLTVPCNRFSPKFLTLSKLKYPAWHVFLTSSYSENRFPACAPSSASESLWNCDVRCSWSSVKRLTKGKKLPTACKAALVLGRTAVTLDYTHGSKLCSLIAPDLNPTVIHGEVWTKLSCRQNIESLWCSEAAYSHISCFGHWRQRAHRWSLLLLFSKLMKFNFRNTAQSKLHAACYQS